MNTSEKQAARTGALPVLTAVMAPDVPLEVVGEADTPTLTNEKRSLCFCSQKVSEGERVVGEASLPEVSLSANRQIL